MTTIKPLAESFLCMAPVLDAVALQLESSADKFARVLAEMQPEARAVLTPGLAELVNAADVIETAAEEVIASCRKLRQVCG